MVSILSIEVLSKFLSFLELLIVLFNEKNLMVKSDKLTIINIKQILERDFLHFSILAAVIGGLSLIFRSKIKLQVFSSNHYRFLYGYKGDSIALSDEIRGDYFDLGR